MIQPVILCGGSGTRLWPLSREHHPKPLHAVNGERTLLQETALRCTAEPLLVCNESHRFLVQAQLRRAGVRPKAIILESKGRGTAPALTLAAVHAVTADDPVLLAMPSDHFIAEPRAFQQAMERGAALARKGGIVAFGVPPAAAETGYGYIKFKSEYVEQFVEKPDVAR
ncbi:MAG TPA: sugar phosphate nucleotidyltransferase, partial [Burkholderiales bacterium]|nr:sugar phosphate nucleotidyltransferase [Burkholderiales bacterium]